MGKKKTKSWMCRAERPGSEGSCLHVNRNGGSGHKGEVRCEKCGAEKKSFRK